MQFNKFFQRNSPVFQSLFLLTITLIFSCLISCSGGGGDGGGSTSGGRTSKTAVRIIHSAIDSSPLGVFSNGVYLGKSSYLGQNEFYPIGLGPNILNITQGDRAGSPVESISLDAVASTEYTLFAYGALGNDQFKVRAIPEPIIRPESGLARFQVLNGLSDTSLINFFIGSISNQAVAFGQTSGFIELPAGIYDVRITSSRGGLLSAVSVTLPDRGELSLVVSGKLDYEFVSIKTYEDLD